MDLPGIGRIVHYRSYGTPRGEFLPECRSAIVTEVNADLRFPELADDTVGLCAVNPTGLFWHPLAQGGCPHDEAGADGGTWHWPEPAGQVEDVLDALT